MAALPSSALVTSLRGSVSIQLLSSFDFEIKAVFLRYQSQPRIEVRFHQRVLFKPGRLAHREIHFPPSSLAMGHYHKPQIGALHEHIIVETVIAGRINRETRNLR